MSLSAATTRDVRDSLMRFSFLIILVACALLAAVPAKAQTFDPKYPVCMHVYGMLLGERMDCLFVSLEQCAMTASGLPASCIVNPYYVATDHRQKRPRRH
jgi:Protein of unknown function (DUF3551)